MARNAKFKNVYEITVEGKTSNGFTAKILDKIFKDFSRAIGIGYQQVKTSVKVIHTSGDWDAENEVNKAEIDDK